MKHIKLLKISAVAMLVLLTVSAIAVSGLYLYLAPQLPSIEGLSDVRLQTPLRIYSSDGTLLGEFGEKRRTPKTLDEIPVAMKQAFLAAEDDRFFEHPGVDYQGILRAALNLVITGQRGQGGSTITMQLARNFYLSSEKTYARKLSEILLALKIERELSKEKILELYLNKIYLGNRSYGVEAAAQTYYGLTLNELSVAQIAMIAGLPKAPSRYNPIVNPDRALARRNYVLSRMNQEDFLSDEEYELAKAEAVSAERHHSQVEVEAPYVNEMVRAEIVEQFGDEAYTRGLRVYTTIDNRMQQAANDSLWQGLVRYDQRHGYRGVIRHIDLETVELTPEPADTEKDDDVSEQTLAAEDETLTPEAVEDEAGAEAGGLERLLADDRTYGRFMPALVISAHEEDDPAAQLAAVVDTTAAAGDTAASEAAAVEPESEPLGKHARLLLKSGEEVILKWEGMVWARKYVSLNRVGDEPASVAEILKPGDVIWVSEAEIETEAGDIRMTWVLGQIPEIQGALVAISPSNGAIKALNGGFNFNSSNFNRVVQAKRQAGSSFKPIVYSSALEDAYTPASIINDAPVVFQDSALEGAWRPENYSGKFYGPTRLREALVRSRNLVSIRLLRSVGVGPVTRFAEKFGLQRSALPYDLSLALGSCELSPLELSRAFSVFANGGYLVEPYFIQRIEDADGSVLFEADPLEACASCVLAERGRTPVQIPDENQDESDDTLVKLPRQAERTLEPRVAYIMHSILQDVVRRGTGVRAMKLGRNDLAGKTGTTNDQRDAWFNGYQPGLVGTAWVGFDQQKPLGNGETGSRAALPIWMDFMKVALAGVPEIVLPPPEGMVTVKVNADTGEAATDLDQNTVFEIFRAENAPQPKAAGTMAPTDPENSNPIPEQMF